MSAQLEVSTAAHEKLTEILDDHPTATAVRVMVKEDRCNGPSLLLAFDQPKPTDATAEQNGVIYAIDLGLLEALEGVSIDLVQQDGRGGFEISSKAPLGRPTGDCKEGCGC